MVTPRHTVAVVVCLFCLLQATSAFLRKSSNFKRLGQVPGSGTVDNNSEIPSSSLFFKGDDFPSQIVGHRHGSVVLECVAGGTPSPTIYWLKNGVRIWQGSSRKFMRHDERSIEGRRGQDSNMLRLSLTQSKLYLDCLNTSSEGQYTCVAENALLRKSRTTSLRVENSNNSVYPEVRRCNRKKHKTGEPARIYMWTVSRLEYVHNLVQLFCRAQGFPRPNISWYRDNKPIHNDDDYQITANGDLIIKDITWEKHRFLYFCVASNVYGTDAAEAFLYPTIQDDGTPL